MKVVVLSRAPAFYPWKSDRCLGHLVSEGHEVLAVVVEKSRPLRFLRDQLRSLGWRIFLRKALRKLTGSFVGPQHQPGSPLHSPVRFRIIGVRSHNDPECVELIRLLNPDLIVLRGCGIIKAPLLEVPRKGTINAHYGLLPRYRGRNVTEWAVLYGDSVGVTVHIVDRGIDSGALLACETIPVEPGDTLGTLLERSAAMAARLLTYAVSGLERGSITPQPQEADAGRQFFEMHPRLRRLAEQRLRRS